MSYAIIISSTIKVCPICKSDGLILLRSLRYKQCNKCGEKIKWDLSSGQKPLIEYQR